MKRITFYKAAVLVLLFIVMSSAGMIMAQEVSSPAPASALRIDTGDTAWMIVATALVMLMSLPGLTLFYGSLAKGKDALNTMAMSFVTYAIVSILWVLYGYTFSFGTDI